jgi:carbon storage regulator
MLVFSRKKNETVIINHNITITITDIKAGVVKIGVDAPRDIVINRGEIEALVNRDTETVKVESA